MKLSNKKILITGGAGFIGSALAHRLHRENAEIVIFDDFSTGQLTNIPPDCTVIQGSITDYKPLDSVKNVDYVFHFGAPSSVILFNANPEKCMSDTIIGLRNSFEFALNNSVKKVIFPSSSSVYGNSPLPQSETTPTHPTNLYGVAKLTCEYLAGLYIETVPSIALRIFAGYGPGEAHKGPIASIVNLFFESIARGSQPVIYGDGTQSRDFTFVKNVVNANIKACESNETGVFNIACGRRIILNDLISMINELLGRDIAPKYVDSRPGDIKHSLADISKAKSFGYNPKDEFMKELEETIEFFRGN
jgi:UDP-glucose 4-epimerase